MPKLFEDNGFTFRFYADLDEWKRSAVMQVEVIKLPYQPPHAETKIELTIPIAIPDLELVRAFAHELHRQGLAWQGAYGGWPVYYTPEDRTQKPPHSKQAFRPAEFWIGTDPLWTFTLSWEKGAEEEPFELESKYFN